jgi:hypothetical protein
MFALRFSSAGAAARWLFAVVVALVAAASAGRAEAKLYVLLVGSVEDPGIGACCKNDLKEMILVFGRLAAPNDIAMKLAPPVGATILRAIRECPAGRDDAILVYYTGHGGYNRQHGQFLGLTSANGAEILPRTDVRNALKAKGVRLTALITDCCYSHVPIPAGPEEVGAAPPNEMSAAILQSLFFKARGEIDITSSQKDTPSAVDQTSKRSIFTIAMVQVMRDRANDALSWDQFFLEVRDAADAEFQRVFPGGVKDREGKVVQNEQLALAFRLPGDTALDKSGPRFGVRGLNTGGQGVRIKEVFAGYPGQKAGLRPGDTIVGINGTAVRTEADYDKAVDSSGQEMDVAIVRADGSRHVITVRLRY